MKEKISKFISVLRKDGMIKTLKKTYKYGMANYINKINIIRSIEFKIKKKSILLNIKAILNESSYNRIIVWRGSFGWNVPLYQRPQHIAKCLSDEKCLVFYEVTRMTDKTKFIDKFRDNLFLVNYEIKNFEEILFEELKKVNKPKYLQLYSTCWDVSDLILKKYTDNGFTLLYEYIDDLNPVLAGTKDLPENVRIIHEYVCNNPSSSLVVTSADRLYQDIVNKRKGKENVIMSTNGVDYKHFSNENLQIPDNKNFKDIIAQNKPIIGYYGALASWFDYDLVKYIAKENKNTNIVLIGIKYDCSFDESKIEEYDNIHYLGPIDYKDLPSYAKFFNICTVPFKINEITLATNPIKIFEYMALGKPIITTAMPECYKYKSVLVAENKEEFNQFLNTSLNYNKEDNKDYFEILKREALANTWESKTRDIVELLERTEGYSYKEEK